MYILLHKYKHQIWALQISIKNLQKRMNLFVCFQHYHALFILIPQTKTSKFEIL